MLKGLVSVPYRGYSFFNLINILINCINTVKFPSLTGVIHFLIPKRDFSYNVSNSSKFPSLTGVIHFLM